MSFDKWVDRITKELTEVDPTRDDWYKRQVNENKTLNRKIIDATILPYMVSTELDTMECEGCGQDEVCEVSMNERLLCAGCRQKDNDKFLNELNENLRFEGVVIR